MRRQRDTGNDTPGYDSFLDIVANLVGILVILIMVLGVRARDAWQHSDETTPSVVDVSDVPSDSNALSQREVSAIAGPQVSANDNATLNLPELAVPERSHHASSNEPFPPLEDGFARTKPTDNATEIPSTQSEPLELPDVDSARQEAETMRQASYEIDMQLAQVDEQLSTKTVYRDQLIAALNVAQEQVATYNNQLAAISQERASNAAELSAAEAQLANIQGQIDRASTAAKPEVIALTHRPAPMAQTVFGREEHFRLHAGRISYVPMLEIRDRLQNELKNKSWKLKQTPQIMETFGPVGDYYVRYMLVRSRRKIRTESGPVMRSMISLDHFELAPSSEILGVSVGKALADGSQFQQLLSQYRPSEVTVTVWTYPDSYAELRQLKDELWKRGYLVATRPLPHGVSIGGSPDGSRSMAE